MLEKLAEKYEHEESKDDEGSDSSFDRMSNDDLNINESSLLKKEQPNNYTTVDKDGVKWTHLNSNDDKSWLSCKRCERWVIIDGLRHTNEEQAKEEPSKYKF